LGVEGLVPSSEPVKHPGEPGLGEPLSTEDPLAGLNLLEDSRFFVHEPSAGDNASAPVVEAARAPVQDNVPEIDTIDLQLEHPELHEEKPHRHEERPAHQEEKPHPAPVSKAPPRVPTPRAPEPVEEEEAKEVEEEVEEEDPAPKPSKPQLVQPLRMTRPKKKAKTPEREEPLPASAQRQPVNPFLRQKPKKAPSPKAGQRVATPPSEVPRAATPKENPPQQPADNFVDLAAWMHEDRGPRSYRMIAEEARNREQGEEADFTDMLEKFKAGVAANVDDEDFDSHYDLGVAYKEMGLIEDAYA